MPVSATRPSPRLSQLVLGLRVDDAWADALPDAEHIASQVLAAHGALSKDDGFFTLITTFAKRHYALERSASDLDTALELGVRNIRSRNRIADLAGETEIAHWQAAYLVGVCVGFQLAAGGAQ